MFDSFSTLGADFDSGHWATIRSGGRLVARQGRVVIVDGALVLLDADGVVIDHAPLSAVTLRRGLRYPLDRTPTVTLGRTSYRVGLSYDSHVASGMDYELARSIQSRDNDLLRDVIREHRPEH